MPPAVRLLGGAGLGVRMASGVEVLVPGDAETWVPPGAATPGLLSLAWDLNGPGQGAPSRQPLQLQTLSNSLRRLPHHLAGGKCSVLMRKDFLGMLSIIKARPREKGHEN